MNLLILYYIKNPVFKISFKKIEFRYSKEIFSVGAGVFSREIVEAIVLVLYNTIILNIGGATYLAAFSIINKIIMVVYMPVGGFVEGLQPIISVNYGAKKLDRIKLITLKYKIKSGELVASEHSKLSLVFNFSS